MKSSIKFHKKHPAIKFICYLLAFQLLMICIFLERAFEIFGIGFQWTKSRMVSGDIKSLDKTHRRGIQGVTLIKQTGLNTIIIDYSETIRIDETKSIIITFNLDSRSQTPGQDILIFAQIFSPSLTISPEKIEKKFSGSEPPQILSLVTPKSEGNHAILIEIKILSSSINHTDSATLPVTVLTIWGISKWFYNFIQGVCALISFVLICPLIIDWLRSRFKKR